MSENQNDGGDFGPIEVETATVTAVEDGVDGEPPILRVPDATGDHEGHGEENDSLQERLLADQKTGDGCEYAIGHKEDLSLLKIKRLQINESGKFHASLL